MKPFTIRKAVVPGQSRAGNLSHADAVGAEMSSSKYATGGDRLQSSGLSGVPGLSQTAQSGVPEG